MYNIVKKVPIPLCGVALSWAALGNLLQSYSEGVRLFCGAVSGILLFLFILKLILFPKMIWEDMQNPIMASVAGTFPMVIMLLSVYVKPVIGQAAYIIWIAAILLHIVLIVYFTVRFIPKLQMKDVFASYYIIYVGIVAASVTASAYEKTGLGTAIFWIGFVILMVLIVLVSDRYLKYRDIPDPSKPLICIYAAPLNLCIVGYIQSVAQKDRIFLLILFAAACVFYLFALIRAVKYLIHLPFYPSYAAFTFPFVISAISAKQLMACLDNMGHPIPALSYVVLIETTIAVAFVVYTLLRYIGFLFGTAKSQS